MLGLLEIEGRHMSAGSETGSIKRAFTRLAILLLAVSGSWLCLAAASPLKSAASLRTTPTFRYAATRSCLEASGLIGGAAAQLTAALGEGTYIYASRSGHTAKIDVEPNVTDATQQYAFDRGSGLVERFRNVEIVWFKGNPPTLLKAFDSHPPRTFRAAVLSCLRT